MMKAEEYMARDQLMKLVLEEFRDQSRHELEDVIRKVRASSHDVHGSDVKSAVLGLLRRHQLELTDDFALQRPKEKQTVA